VRLHTIKVQKQLKETHLYNCHVNLVVYSCVVLDRCLSVNKTCEGNVFMFIFHPLESGQLPIFPLNSLPVFCLPTYRVIISSIQLNASQMFNCIWYMYNW